MYTLSSVYILNMHSFCQAFLNKAGRKKKKNKRSSTKQPNNCP